MRDRHFLRWAVAALVAAGLFLTWSSRDPSLYLDDWHAQQAAEAANVPAKPPTVAGKQVAPETSSTPTPAPATPVASPLPTPTPATNGAMAVDCDATTPGVQSQCAYPAGAQFSIQVFVPSPPASGYIGFQAKLRWADAVLNYLPTSNASSEVLWPGCGVPVHADNRPADPSASFGCISITMPPATSTFAGAILQLQMQCSSDGVSPLTLVPRSEDPQLGTVFVDPAGSSLDPALAAATITCGQAAGPTPTPSPTPSPAPTSPSTDVPALPGTVMEQDITQLGGRIDSTDRRVSIDFPPSAITERLRVRITHRDVTQFAPILDHPFMTGWDFQAFALDRSMATVDQFPANVRITVNYTPDDLEGRNPDTLRLWTWNEAAGQWQTLSSQHVPNSGTVIADVNHFSTDIGTADPAVLSPGFLRAYQTDLQAGASQVTLPIDVPKGRGGLTPNLTLSYHSNRVDEMKSWLAQGSWTGVGWDLSVGSIRPIFKRYPGDTARFFLELNGTGDEIIQGSDLVWRSKHHEYLDIRQVGPSPCTVLVSGVNTPCYWVVTDKQGAKYYFGGTENGPDQNASRFYDYLWSSDWKYRDYYYRWDLRKVVDTHSNAILYSYDPRTVPDCPNRPPEVPCHDWVFASYPANVLYDFNGVYPSLEIDFNLAGETVYSGFPNIPLRADAPRNSALCGGYQIPNRVEETRKLASIDIRKNGTDGGLVSRYDLGYGETGFGPDGGCTFKSGTLQLNSLQQSGSLDGVGSTPLSTMTFGYDPKHYGYWVSSTSEFVGFDRIFLTTATNGFGGQALYDYAERKKSLIANEATWSREIVTQRTLNPGTGSIPAVTTDYEYPNADEPKYLVPNNDAGSPDYWNEEFRGFGRVKERAADGSYAEHDFHTTGGYDETLSGRENETRVFAADGTRWRLTHNYWGFRCLPDPNNCGPLGVTEVTFVSLNAVDVREGLVPPGQQDLTQPIRTEYDYDEFGNLEVERRLGLGSDQRTIWRPYHQATGPYVFLPKFEHLYAGSQTKDWLRANFANPNPQPPVSETTYFYDGAARYTYPPSKGELSGVHRWYGLTNVYFEYDASGNKTKESVPTSVRIIDQPEANGTHTVPATVARTSWQYDADRITFPTSMTNPLNQATLLDWQLRQGVVRTKTEPTGRVWTYTYDAFGRLLTARDNLTGSGLPATEQAYQWNSTGTSSTWTRHRTASGAYIWETHCFDGFGREFQARKSYKTTPSPLRDSVVETGYDAQGRVKYRSEPFEDSFRLFTGCGTPETTTDALGVAIAKTAYLYNPLGEVNQTTNPDPDGTVRKSDRNGLTTTVSDEKQHQTAYLSDAYGQLAQVTEYTGRGVPADPYLTYAITSYTYDKLGDLTRIQDGQRIYALGHTGGPIGNITNLFYDPLGRKSKMDDMDMGLWTYQYDAAGNLTRQIDAREQSVYMEYDALNRLTKKCYGGACGLQPNVVFTYDSSQAACDASDAPVGQLTRVVALVPQQSPITDQWCHDVRGRVTKERRTVDGVDYDVLRSYDDADRLGSITYPNSGEVATYTYDPGSGQQQTFYSNPSTFVANATYDPAFRPLTIDLGTSPPTTTRTQYSYDSRGRVKTINTAGGAVQNLSYDYDYAGNVRHINDGPSSLDLFYDDRNRLSTVTNISSGYTAGYTYDEVGNLTTQGEPGLWGPGSTDAASLTYSPARPHAVILAKGPQAGETRVYRYDKNGNVVALATGAAAPPLVDSNGAGCLDTQKAGPSQESCGQRSATNFWDFYDVNHDCAVDINNDVLIVAQAFGQSSGPNYTVKKDRTIGGSLDWQTGAADGVINVNSDMLRVPRQFGDRCGNPALAFPTQFAYDEENRLKSRTDSATTTPVITSYVYDGQGGLAKKTVAVTQPDLSIITATTVYIDDIYEQTGNSVTKYYWFGGKRVAMRKDGTLSYLLSDHLGSTNVVLDSAGTVMSTQKYYPYGHTRADVSTANPPTDKLFTGHQREQDDMYYMKSRFYDPVAGRFLQPDTIVPDPKNPQALNRYSYVYNNPMTYTDPTGRYPNDPAFYCLIGLGCNSVAPNRQLIPTTWPLCQNGGICLAGELEDCQTTFCRGVNMVFNVVAAPIIDVCAATTGTTLCVGGEHVSTGGRVWAGVNTGVLLATAGFSMLPERLAAGATEREMTTLFRIVGEREAHDIVASGAYRTVFGMTEGKHFYPTAEQAIRLGEFYADQGSGPQFLTSGRVHNSVLVNLAEEVRPLREGVAYFFEKEVLPFITDIKVALGAPVP